MAEAIITGMMDKKIIDKDRVVVADPNAGRLVYRLKRITKV